METAVPPDPRIEDLLRGVLSDPFAFLGLQPGPNGKDLLIRCFKPGATAVSVVEPPNDALVARLEQVHPAGLFAGAIKRSERFVYRLRVEAPSGPSVREDPYRFGPVLGEVDRYLLTEGTHLDAFDRLGAQHLKVEGVAGIGFAVWAPNARSVSVVGDFNGWDGRVHPMRRNYPSGVWDLFIPALPSGARYKYEIHGPDGALLPLKADPYAAQAEQPPATASVVAAPDRFAWSDGAWAPRRSEANARDKPISVYEVHLGSWRRGDGNRYLTYREMAAQLVPYVVDMGFTHIEVLPIAEYPFDGSWGYQPTGLCAPTSRFGSPEDFMELVDACHRAGVGLWVDWVGGHFPNDAHGLGAFDGTHLYEHADPRQGFHRDWNTLIYNFGRREVADFLINCALCWLERYHVDGLRLDAVASMLYLDYSRRAGEWIPNALGGRENLDAVAFLRRLNELVYGKASGVATVAEESTSWPNVSRPASLGGLGFGYKWNMGWMHDTLEYMALDPVYRKYHHDRITFGMVYAFSENFVLPLSHDEVVHGKASLLNKMPGDPWKKFANLRVYYGFMWGHPGKKLLFMGGEFAQPREWNHDVSLDWHLLGEPLHAGMQRLARDLNALYRGEPALHELDCDPRGFEWVVSNDVEQSVVAFLRKGTDGWKLALVICNFTPNVRSDYRIGVPVAGRWNERINTDAGIYGGSGVGNAGGVDAQAVPAHRHQHSLCVTVPPLAALIFTPAG